MEMSHGTPIKIEQSGPGAVTAVDISEGPPLSHTKHVLVMDDDELVCNCLRLLLTSMGYRVTLTKDSYAAIDSYKQAMMRGEPVDVVILDLHLPSGLNGKETVKKLLSLDPGVKAVVSSGDASDPGITDFRDFGFKDVLVKPVIYDELNAVLSALAPLQG
jgi:CheY-like chemotaxis protein